MNQAPRTFLYRFQRTNQLVAVRYESCEELFKKLGFRIVNEIQSFGIPRRKFVAERFQVIHNDKARLIRSSV